jgi:hypothetical protein
LRRRGYTVGPLTKTKKGKFIQRLQEAMDLGTTVVTTGTSDSNNNNDGVENQAPNANTASPCPRQTLPAYSTQATIAELTQDLKNRLRLARRYKRS